MATALRGRSGSHPLVDLLFPERLLSSRDPTLASLIRSQAAPWPSRPTEDPIWGLLRIVMAQQVSTVVACRVAEKVRSAYPLLTTACTDRVPEVQSLRAFGLPELRARCCVNILTRSDEIRAKVKQGQPWIHALAG